MKTLLALFFVFISINSQADEPPKFSVTADRNSIAEDESVALRFTIESSSGSLNSIAPNFRAPDFEVLSSMQSSSFESTYHNGKFGMKRSLTITKVLRPKKTGSLKIFDIFAEVEGSKVRAPTVTINVIAGGQGTPPGKNYGTGSGLSGGSKNTRAENFFVKAEVSKSEVFKGQQVIVSYYIYVRTKVFNMSVSKYPELKGFLREDLDLPVLRPRLSFSTVALNGVSYQRALLARYAAYPLKDGNLKIDPIRISANYYANEQGGGNARDPYDPFRNFFRQMTPLTASKSSKVITLTVNDLPVQGRPPSFTGGVGSFNVVSAIDKYEVRANEPVTLTVKVEGRGNVAAIEEPNPSWPTSVELYEAKGKAKAGSGGVGEKIFEFLLIPRAPGKVSLSPLEFSFFNPDLGTYVTESTKEISLNVLPPAPGSAVVKRQGISKTAIEKVKSEDIRYLQAPFKGQPFSLKWIVYLASGIFLLVIVFVGLGAGVGSFAKKKTKQADSSFSARWSRLASAAKSGSEIDKHYDELKSLIFDEIDFKFRDKLNAGARSFSRSELENKLVNDHGLDAKVWKIIKDLLSHIESARFSGADSGTDKKTNLSNWIAKAHQASKRL